jgi:hypothetical protein
MKSYEANALIDATPAAVWSVLVDGANYTGWDSGVARLDGRIAPGEKLKMVSETSPGRAVPLKVTEFAPERSMVWTGGMPLGLFRGVRTFTLTPAGKATTRFQMREEFSGPLLPLIWRAMPDLGPSFEQFAEGLKREAEKQG